MTARRILRAFLFPEKSKELVHAGFRAILAVEPDGSTTFEIADHDPRRMALADRDLVDADRLRSRRAGALQLRPHVLLVEFLDRVPVEGKFHRHVLDRLRAAAPSDVGRKATGIERVAREPIEPFALHEAAAATIEPPNVELQIDPKRTTGKVPDPAFPAVVPTTLDPSAAAAGRFFDRRRSTMTRARGSPNTPRVVGSGRQPGNAYASHSRRGLDVLAIRK